MRLDGFGLFVEDMAKMIRFYRDVLGFEIKESEDTSNVYLVKDGTLFLLYGRKDFENMTHRRYEYIKGLNGHSEIALYVDTFEEVDMAYKRPVFWLYHGKGRRCRWNGCRSSEFFCKCIACSIADLKDCTGYKAGICILLSCSTKL